MPKRIQLYEERGETSRFIDVEIEKDGDLVLCGQDVGKAPLEWWGDSDYEFWVTVSSEHKDDLLLALVDRLYGGNSSAVDELRDFLAPRGIDFEFGTWI